MTRKMGITVEELKKKGRPNKITESLLREKHLVALRVRKPSLWQSLQLILQEVRTLDQEIVVCERLIKEGVETIEVK